MMWRHLILHLLLIVLNSSGTEIAQDVKDLCQSENWTTLNLKVIQDENDIKRITSNKCAISLQNLPAGKLTKAIINLLPRHTLKILQITGKMSWIDDESMTSLRSLKLLKLSGVDLENSEISKGVGGFTKNIESLDLSHNNLSNLDFFKTESKKVKKLNLENNKLDTVPEELKVFESLVELLMANNKIRNISLTHTMGYVEYVDFSHNMISNIYGLFHFPNSQVINLRSNLIHNLEDTYFESDQYELQEIFLDYNFIEALPIRILFNLPHLKTFSIMKNRLRKIIPTTLSADKQTYTKLEYLNIGENFIDEIPHSFLKWFPDLKTLKVNSNKLSYLRASTFANLNKLTNLDLSDNEFVKFEVKRFIPLEALSVLNISNNRIEQIDYFSLFIGLPNLKTIKLDGNSFFCENLVEMLRFFEKNNIQVEEGGQCEGKEHIKGICCVDSTKNYTENKLSMASFLMMTQKTKYSKELSEILETFKNVTQQRKSSENDLDGNVFITKATFWTGLGIVILFLFLILSALIFAMIMKKKEIHPVHL